VEVPETRWQRTCFEAIYVADDVSPVGEGRFCRARRPENEPFTFTPTLESEATRFFRSRRHRIRGARGDA